MRQRAAQRIFDDEFVHSQNLRAHRVASGCGNAGVAFVPGQYRQQPCFQHIALAVRGGTAVEQGAAVDPRHKDAGGGQELGKERQLCLRGALAAWSHCTWIRTPGVSTTMA